ncbi:MAG TPA: hypothetical protein PLK94_04125 [Alphaproteobacteria bacterium]|nr:hypothetical protein [Alphaproteobacteria bacterium]HOO50459.1 hypothetical protein [Alphaproteobacteria bacterium]
MKNFSTYLDMLRQLPEIEHWEDAGVVVVDKPEDFFCLYDIQDKLGLLGGRAITCPIPQHLLPDQETLASYFAAVRGHSKYREFTDDGCGDKVCEVPSYTPKTLKEIDRELPASLVQLKDLLIETFNRSIRDYPHCSTYYRINSTHHRRPTIHLSTGVLHLAGETTRVFVQDEKTRQLIGKKSLPSNSITTVLGLHAAPDTESPRFNILCSTY